MNFAGLEISGDIWGAIKVIAQYIGYISTVGGAILLCSRRARAYISKLIKHDAGTEEIKKALENMKKDLGEVKNGLRDLRAANRDTLRNDITEIYYEGVETKTIPAYKKESVLKMYADYERLEGNSYVKTIVEDEIKTWRVI